MPRAKRTVLATILTMTALIGSVIGANSAHADTMQPLCNGGSVGLVGDSTALGLLGAVADRTVGAQELTSEDANSVGVLGEQLIKAGVTRLDYDASSGRAVSGQVNGQPSGTEALTNVSGSQPGCYIVILGTNDAAAVAGGSSEDATARINAVLAVTGSTPVYWVEPEVTEDATAMGIPFADQVRGFNDALHTAASGTSKSIHPIQMTQDRSWFADDGIHYTTEGSAERAKLIVSGIEKDQNLPDTTG